MNTRDEPAPTDDDYSIDNRHERRKDAALERRAQARKTLSLFTAMSATISAGTYETLMTDAAFRSPPKPGPSKEKRATRKRAKQARKAARR